MPEAIVVVYKPLHTVVFIKAVRYICVETFVHITSILLSYMETCIATIMYCLRLFLLFTLMFLGGPT